MLDEIIRDAQTIKTALSAALPLSWSGEGSSAMPSEIVEENSNGGDTNTEKLDSVSAAGIEMVELVILAAQIMKEKRRRRSEESTDFSESTLKKQ